MSATGSNEAWIYPTEHATSYLAGTLWGAGVSGNCSKGGRLLACSVISVTRHCSAEEYVQRLPVKFLRGSTMSGDAKLGLILLFIVVAIMVIAPVLAG